MVTPTTPVEYGEKSIPPMLRTLISSQIKVLEHPAHIAAPIAVPKRLKYSDNRSKPNPVLHYQEPITRKSRSSIYDPAAALATNRIEILDTATNEAVNSGTSQTSLDVKQDGSFVLKPEVGSYFFWTTSTETPRWREYPFDISLIISNREYTLVYQSHGISEWYNESHSSLEGARSQTEAQPGDLLQGSLIGNQHPKFTARAALRPPPPVTTTLSTSSPTCSLSGQPPFTVFLNCKLHETRPIYALVLREGGRVIALDIRGPEENGRRIELVPDVEQGGVDNAPSNDEELFVPLTGPEDFFSQEYTLVMKPRQNRLLHSDTWNLKTGKQYEISLRKSKWRWMYQDEVEDGVRQNQAKLKEILRREPFSMWKPDNRVDFQAD